MPKFVVQRLVAALNDAGRAARGARVLILGIAYKPDVDDVRETPAAEIIAQLRELGVAVGYHDPHVAEFPQMRRYPTDFDLRSQPLTAARLREADAVLIVTHHSAIDWDLVAEASRLVVDTRNVMAGRNVRGRLVQA
jgi:UDP-N-acetyl-D-glucosamine dehydrogenase